MEINSENKKDMLSIVYDNAVELIEGYYIVTTKGIDRLYYEADEHIMRQFRVSEYKIVNEEMALVYIETKNSIQVGTLIVYKGRGRPKYVDCNCLYAYSIGKLDVFFSKESDKSVTHTIVVLNQNKTILNQLCESVGITPCNDALYYTLHSRYDSYEPGIHYILGDGQKLNFKEYMEYSNSN